MEYVLTSAVADGLNRRTFLGSSVGIAIGLGMLGPAALPYPAPAAGPTFFGHGVASGDPLPDAVVLWTRVTPTPDATPGSARGQKAVVRWEVSELTDFRVLTASGTITTGRDQDHTVKIDATGLTAATNYYYRFI